MLLEAILAFPFLSDFLISDSSFSKRNRLLSCASNKLLAHGGTAASSVLSSGSRLSCAGCSTTLLVDPCLLLGERDLDRDLVLDLVL